MGEKYVQQLYISSPKEDEEDEGDVHCAEKMVGLVYEFNKLKHRLRISWLKSTQVTALVGMTGIGKTTLAGKLLEDPKTEEHFDCRVWVTVGKECRFKEIPRRILAAEADLHSLMGDPWNPQQFANTSNLDPPVSKSCVRHCLAELNGETVEVEEGDEDVIAVQLKESLKGKRYLIVLDDVWDRHPSFRYERNELKSALQDVTNGSQVVFTTRLQQLDDYGSRLSTDGMRVFGEEPCSFQLEKIGKKIAKKCDGLPLMIVAIANLLAEEDKTVECWGEIAAHKNHPIFMDAYDDISKVLLPSYKYLPRLLQMCFLYMGVFPRNDHVSRSKLMNMWSVDGFLEENADESLYPSAEKCLDELVSNSLVTIHQTTLDDSGRLGAKQIKKCGLHSSLWHLSNQEATKIKFSYVLKTSNDAFDEGVESQCRLSFHNNILFGIREVCESVEEKCASTAHSLLCYGPYQKYQVPICSGLALLRKLDALTIHFYEFPMEVLELVQIRYLALTLNGELPSSISQLSSLEFLIVNQHLSIKSGEGPMHLPKEIWDMKELKQLQVIGSDLPDPCGASLESLLTLSGVSAESCNVTVLKSVPNLKKLGIQISLEDDDIGSPLYVFNHIPHLTNLRSLKCVITNPEVVVPVLAPMSIFPRNLTKLNLSGMGYPWKETSKISSLPCLQVLKLRSYAFQGPEWEVEEGAFSFLTFLIIEDTDLEDWKIGRGSFDDLETLTMKHCYNLERIHGEFGGFLGGIKLIDCDPSCAEQMMKATQDWKVDVHSSWDDKK
ncbi:putative late blight resistance protein homolog R1A-10 [Salvia hispanica]|uniref:putative late blight resistance protein homolog R1A-10 n=1 Tax=Salvia hispanica TaxID=49212 RepID=UPI00200945DB|nr:putative late blight resistance protein homolog R1A-10 [Salvia hispanica]